LIIQERQNKHIPGGTSLFLSFDFNQKIIDAIKATGYYYYDKKTHEWEVPLTSLAQILDSVCYYDDIALDLLSETETGNRDLQCQSDYKSKPFDYQLDGIRFGLNHNNFLLLDVAGLGKSLQMIYLAEELKAKEGLEHCLIICGINTLKSNWEKEIKKHSNLDCVIIGKKVTSTGKVSYTSIPDRCVQIKNKVNEFFIIVNIETLRSSDFIEALRTSQNKIDMVVFDELHKASSSQTQQAKGLMKLPNYKHKIGLTGTLITNNPINCFLPLKWIGKEHCNLTAFKSYYCEYSGPFHNDLVGFKNMGLLKNQIADCSLRRDKSMLNLPPKVYVEELLDMPDSQQRFYDEIKQGVRDQVDKVNLSTQSLLSMVTRLRQATADPYMLSSNDIPSVKLERTCQLIDEIVENGGKVVVFSTFKEPLRNLWENLINPEYEPLLCTGDIPDDVISENIDKFQNHDNHKVMLCTMSKMGTGVTLTAANYEIFLDQAWTSALETQAEDRCHRVGTTDSVTIYKLICNGTIDERVAEIVKTKEAISDYIIDDRISESTIENLRRYIMEL